MSMLKTFNEQKQKTKETSKKNNSKIAFLLENLQFIRCYKNLLNVSVIYTQCFLAQIM